MKNPEYVYFTIGMLKDGPTHRALLDDAREHAMKQLPKLASIRLSDYYKNKGLLPVEAVVAVPHDIESNVEAADEAWPE